MTGKCLLIVRSLLQSLKGLPFGSTSEGAFASYYESQRKLLDKSLQKAIDNYKKIEG